MRLRKRFLLSSSAASLSLFIFSSISRRPSSSCLSAAISSACICCSRAISACQRKRSLLLWSCRSRSFFSSSLMRPCIPSHLPMSPLRSFSKPRSLLANSAIRPSVRDELEDIWRAAAAFSACAAANCSLKAASSSWSPLSKSLGGAAVISARAWVCAASRARSPSKRA